jgi:hypothetical protein
MKSVDLSIIEQATLSVEFAHVDRDEPRGTSLHWEAELCKMPDLRKIPDFVDASDSGSPFGIVVRDPLRRTNQSYYREFAYFTTMRAILRPVRIVVQNIGSAAATDVRIELRVPVAPGVTVLDELPEKPDTVSYGYADIGRGLALRREPGDVEIAKDHHHFKVNIDCGNLQPRRRVWSEAFYIGTELDDPLIVSGQAYAATLSQPHDIALTITASLSRRAFTVKDLIAAAETALD